MLTLAQFVAQWTGKYCSFPGGVGRQCMDSANQYNRDVIGAPRLTGNAIDVWLTFPQSDYVRIANTPTNHPVAGDIIIWTGPNAQVGTDGYGHIAICLQASVQGFTSLDQNWPEQSPCHSQEHSYVAVLGWLHPTKIPRPASPPPASAADAVDVLATHVKALTQQPSVAATNALVHGIKSWPDFSK